MALDIIESKASKSMISKTKRKAPTNICKISFLNKGVELIGVLQDYKTLPLKGVGSGFIDKSHQHLMIGHLRIFGNKKIGKLLTNGPKYRETFFFSWEKANVQKLGAQLLY